MNTHPLVSVVVPTFNYGNFIGPALESVVAQTYPHWECIVVDDGSTDSTRAVVQGLLRQDKRIQYTYQKNRGLSGARNTGIRQSRGDFIQFLDSDDCIELEKIERQVKYLLEHPAVDVVYSDVRYFRTNDLQERRRALGHLGEFSGVSGQGLELQLHLAHTNIMHIAAPLFRRSYIQSVGLFDEHISPVADWEYVLRGALRNRLFHFYACPGTLALVRYHPTSMSAHSWTMRESMFLMQKKLSTLPTAPQVHEISLLAIDYAVGQMLHLALEELEGGQRGQCTRHLIRLSQLTQNSKYRLYAISAATFPSSLFARMLSYSENVVLPRVARLRGRL